MLSWTMRYGGLIAAMVCTAISGHPPPIRTTRRSGLCRVWGRLVKAGGRFLCGKTRRGGLCCTLQLVAARSKLRHPAQWLKGRDWGL